jgi:hypothetical protein
MKTIPSKRTEQTFRIVLQHFEPETGPHGRYRDILSVRLEGEKNESSEKCLNRMQKLFSDVIKSLSGKGKF